MSTKEKGPISRISSLRKLIRGQYAQSKFSFWVYTILRLIIIATLVFSIINIHYEHILMCVIALMLFSMPPIYERIFNVDFPTMFELIILFIVFSAEILGEIGCFYIKFPFWDTMLHTIGGFIFAAYGFSMLDLFTTDKTLKFRVPAACMSIYSFSFSLAISVIWEFFECGMDYFFGRDMQKDTVINSIHSVMLDGTNSNIPVVLENIQKVTINDTYVLPFNGYLDIGLLDTMKDLAVCSLGALIFAIFAYAYVKTDGNNKVAAMFIPVRRNWKEEPPEGLDEELLQKREKFEKELEDRRKEFDHELEERQRKFDLEFEMKLQASREREEAEANADLDAPDVNSEKLIQALADSTK